MEWGAAESVCQAGRTMHIIGWEAEVMVASEERFKEYEANWETFRREAKDREEGDEVARVRDAEAVSMGPATFILSSPFYFGLTAVTGLSQEENLNFWKASSHKTPTFFDHLQPGQWCSAAVFIINFIEICKIPLPSVFPIRTATKRRIAGSLVCSYYSTGAAVLDSPVHDCTKQSTLFASLERKRNLHRCCHSDSGT